MRNMEGYNIHKIGYEFDETNVKTIYSEAFGQTQLGEAIMNRLIKAAAHQVIKV